MEVVAGFQAIGAEDKDWRRGHLGKEQIIR